MNKQIETTFDAMTNVPAQIVVTDDCVEPALAAIDSVESELTALVNVRLDGSKAVIAIPEMPLTDLIKVAAAMESSITHIPEGQGNLFVNRAIPKGTPVSEQEAKVVEEGGYGYYSVRTVLGFGFGNRFSIVDVLLPNERRQDAKSFLYRVQRCKNSVSGVAKDGDAQVFGSQPEAVGFAYGQDPQNLQGVAKSAKASLFRFVGEAKDHLYSSAPSAPAHTGRRAHFARYSDTQSLATLGDVIDVSKLSFEDAPATKPAKPSKKAKKAEPVAAE